MASAKICRNGNESTFRQTSMHHTPAQTNNTNNTNKLLRKQTFNHNTKLNVETSSCHRTPPESAIIFTYKTSIHTVPTTAGHTKHASNTTQPLTNLPTIVEQEDGVVERK
jgi:phosphoribosylcarboxyaminoimidazole (NCAIR) mutase